VAMLLGSMLDSMSVPCIFLLSECSIFDLRPPCYAENVRHAKSNDATKDVGIGTEYLLF
jgi:hypothetical protein